MALSQQRKFWYAYLAMLLSLLFSQPAVFFGWLLALIVSISFHEFSHAFVATRLGDSTPKYDGRLTLNPLAHLDPMGTLLLVLIGFGWGKPVQFNPYNLKYQRFGPALVSLAGPLSNLILIIIFIIALKLLLVAGIATAPVQELFTIAILLNMVLMMFNLIPIAPLDGSKVLYSILPTRWEALKEDMERYGPLLLLGLVVLDRFFNIDFFDGLYNAGFAFVNHLMNIL